MLFTSHDAIIVLKELFMLKVAVLKIFMLLMKSSI